MAILCVRISPNNHPTDKNLDKMRTQIGDVVCIVEDGHVFSESELKCGNYKFINIKDTKQEDLIHLIESDYDEEGNILKLRKKVLNHLLLNNDHLDKDQLNSIIISKV